MTDDTIAAEGTVIEIYEDYFGFGKTGLAAVA